MTKLIALIEKKSTTLLTLILIALALPLTSTATGAITYHTDQLRMMDSRELNEVLTKKFQEAESVRSRTMVRTEDDSISMQESGWIQVEEIMADILRIIWARPDTDGVRRQFSERVQVELSTTDSYPKVVALVAGHAVGALQSKDASAREQETHYNILRNMIAEIRPLIKSDPQLKRVVEMVRDRGIKLSKALESHLALSSMQKGESPSELAQKVLREVQ